jgi:nitroreductase
MELFEAIEKRRTIRIFKKSATEEQLRKIILAGTQAPSAVNRQPWEFVIVKDKAIVTDLAEIKYRQTKENPPQKAAGDPAAVEQLAQSQKDSFQNASIVVVCHLLEWERSVWMCIENMSLAAVAEGLGSGIVLYWGDGQKEAGKVLGLPGDYEITALLKIGVPGEAGYPRDKNPYYPRRHEFSWLHYNRFKSK